MLNATYDFEAATGTVNFGNTTNKTATQVNTAAGETLQVVAVADGFGSSVNTVSGFAIAGADSLSGSVTPIRETSFTFSLVSGKQFDLTSIAMMEWGNQTTENLTFTSSKGTAAYSLLWDGATASTFDVSGDGNAANMQGITSFTITTEDNTMFLNFDTIVLNNIGGAAPTVTSASYDASSNSLVVTATNMTATDGAANDINVNKLTLTGEGGATYTLTSSNVEITSATQFTVALNAADQTAVEGLLNNNGTASVGSTTYNIAAAADWNPANAGNADLTGNAVTVSNVQTPTITSSTYDADTGILVVTGTNLVNADGVANDITANKFTFSGEGGSTYTLVGSSNVEITSATAFTITLDATDKAAVNQIINKNGASSTSAQIYNLAAADDWNTVISNADISDATGNAITASNVAVPAITSTTYDASTGALVVTGTGFLKLTGATNDIVANKFTFTGEGGTTYTLTDSANVELTSATAFTLALSATDKAAINQIINKNGISSSDATTYNLAAAEDWAAGADAAVTVADLTGNGITVGNVAVPAITSSTYDASTGALVVTGTGFLKLNGATNDIVANKFTFTGEGGATYTLTDSANVEITSATAFTLALSATDKAAINQIINKNGISSTGATTYNLAAAEDWAAGADAAVTVADLTGNGITASNVAVPAITSASYDYNANVLTVTGTGFLKKSGATNDIDLSKLTLTGEGGATYTLTNATGVEITSDTSFTATLSGTDLINVEALLNKDGTSAVSTAAYNLAGAEDWAAGADAAVTVADLTGNGITVSNYAAPTVTSATFDAGTNILTVTGTNLVAKSGGTNDVSVSKLILTGEGDNTYTLTSSDVDISNDTTFAVTLNAADQLVVRGLLNKDGTSSSGATTYNLAAAEDWMAGSAAATTVADLAANGITVSNVPTPKISSATYDSDTGVLVVTGTNLFSKVGASNDIDISKLTFTGGTGNATYTITSASDVEITSATAFSITLSGADKTGVDALLDQIGTSSSGGSTYNLAAAEDWLTGADAAATIADSSSNAITVSVSPKITSATYNANTGSLVVTGTNIQALTGATNDISANKFTLTGEGGATYTLTDTANVERDSATQFTLSLSATDKAALNQLLNKAGTASSGGTTYNLAAADDWDANVTAGDTSDTTGNSVTVSNVAVPAITSSTYDANTGSLVVTGTGFLNKSGAINDIVANKFTLTGEGGTTYTLTDSANVELTSATAFTLALSATDKAAINQIINKNGTSSTGATTYNLAAAEDWAAGADAAVVVADLTGNGITVSNVAIPAITNATYDTGSGALVVTGTGFLSASGAANDIDLSKLTFTGLANATYTLTTATDVEVTSTTSFTATLSGADKTAVNALLDKSGATASDASTYNLAAAEDWAVGADPTVTVADATGNSIHVTLYVAPSSGGGTSTPPPTTITETVDGVTVSDSTTTTTTTVTDPTTGTVTTVATETVIKTVPIVTDTRTEEDATTQQADIPLVSNSDGETVLRASLPVGIGLSSEEVKTTTSTTLTLREKLIAASESRTQQSSFLDILGNGIDKYVPGVNDETQVTVRTITFQSDPTQTAAPTDPVIINGATGTGESDSAHPNRQEALVIDVRNLPSDTELQLNNVEFAIIIGAARVTGGNGQNFVVGDDAAQYIVLGAEDDELHGGGGNDFIGSRGGDDKLFGGDGDDTLYGGDDNDTLDGGAGTDFILGGKHSDTAVFSGSSDRYQISYEYGQTVVKSLDDPADIDTVVNVETLQFADKSISVTHTLELSWIATLYQQVMGRQADLGGFQHWSKTSSNGLSDGNIALDFLRSTESRQKTGLNFDNLDIAAKVEFMYTQMLGRPSEESGKAYWLQQFQQGAGLSDIAGNFVHSVELTGNYLAPEGWDFIV